MKEPKDFILLIVDDEDLLRESIAANLGMNDYTIVQASSGSEAAGIINSRHIDFVLTDIQMAQGDGVELLRNIRKKNPDLPMVLMMTGFAKVTKDEVMKLGALDLLEKPLNFDLIEQYIENHRLGLD